MGAFKNKKTGNWLYKFQHQGKIYKKEGFPNRDLAIQAEGRRREELSAPMIETPSASFAQLATEYLKHCQKYMQTNTWRQKSFVYREFIKSIGQDAPADTVSKTMIESFLDTRLQDTGSKAANRSLRDIKALFNWLIEEGLYRYQNPCKRIQRFAEEPYHPYIPPVEDVLQVKLVAGPDERDFIETLYHAIGRKSEASRLTWDDVNFEQRWVRLWTRKRRGGELEAQYKPMNDTLYSVLSRRWKVRQKGTPNVFQFKEKELRSMMARLCDKAKVQRFGFHAIRHHVLSVINDSGKASMKQIQELAGHKRQATTETYLHSMGQAVRDAAGILDEKSVSNFKRGTPEVRQNFEVLN